MLCVIALGVFAANLFWLQPVLAAKGQEQASFFIYLGVRVLAFIGLSYALVRWAGRTRFQTLSTLMGVGMVDQILLKFIATRQALQADPSLVPEAGMPSDGVILFALAQGFLFFAPILLILGFLGVELNRIGKDWKRS